MNAGPGLDALVAQKVMGFRQKLIFLSAENKPALVWGVIPCEDPTPNLYRAHPPAYSRDYAAAFSIVEFLAKKNFLFGVGHKSDLKRYNARFYKDGRKPQATSETIPHAICLAALKACFFDPDTMTEKDSATRWQGKP